MNIANMTITVARTEPMQDPRAAKVFPHNDAAVRVGNVNGKMVFCRRARVFEGAFDDPLGCLIATTTINHVEVMGRFCFQIVVELANADHEHPVTMRDSFAYYDIAFSDCIVLPVFGLSLGGEVNFNDAKNLTVYRFPQWNHPHAGVATSVPTHTAREMRFLAIAPEGNETRAEALTWLTNVVANSAWDEALYFDPSDGDMDLPLKKSAGNLEALQPEAAFDWHRADPLSLWGFRFSPGAAGEDAELGGDPYANIRTNRGAGINLLRRLTAYSGLQPMWMYRREHLVTPNDEAWQFIGEFSDHSRNRCGLPSRHDHEALARYKEGRVALPDTIEHAAFPHLWLAWRTGDPSMCERAIDIGYYIMNSIHRMDISINAGGYNSPLKPIPRCHRMLRCLIQAQVICAKWGNTFPHAARAAEDFAGFIADKIREIHKDEWRQRGYPDYAIFERGYDGQVNGKIAIAAWQAGWPIQVYWWAARNLPQVADKAKDMLAEWTRIVLAAWNDVPAGQRMTMGKLIEARPLGSENWPAGEQAFVHVSLDGLVTWPYAALKLARGYHAALFTVPELQKLDRVIANLEGNWPDLLTGKWGNINAPAEPIHA